MRVSKHHHTVYSPTAAKCTFTITSLVFEEWSSLLTDASGSTHADHFIKNPAFLTAKMTVDKRGWIIFNSQINSFGSQKHMLFIIKMLCLRQFYFRKDCRLSSVLMSCIMSLYVKTTKKTTEVWLGKLIVFDMTQMGWLGHKTSTQSINKHTSGTFTIFTLDVSLDTDENAWMVYTVCYCQTVHVARFQMDMIKF